MGVIFAKVSNLFARNAHLTVSVPRNWKAVNYRRSREEQQKGHLHSEDVLFLYIIL
jgi:hypothetical protein